MWELEKVTEQECTLDDSGVYTVINRGGRDNGKKVVIRVDVMQTEDDRPLRSFVGDGNDVRKCVIAWLNSPELLNTTSKGRISTEHASYIGYEIARAMSDENYIQD